MALYAHWKRKNSDKRLPMQASGAKLRRELKHEGGQDELAAAD